MPSTPAPPASPAASEPLQPIAAVLAFAFPGLGHLSLGYPRRAACICAGVLGLFFGGLLIGGIGCIDRKANFIWFLGQSLNGPIAFAVDYAHQNHFKVVDRSTPLGLRPAHPDEFRSPVSGGPVPIVIDAQGRTSATYSTPSGTVTVSPAYPPYVVSLARMNELGTLFITIAGFLNLICIIDALWHVPRKELDAERAALAKTIKAPTLKPPAIPAAGAPGAGGAA